MFSSRECQTTSCIKSCCSEEMWKPINLLLWKDQNSSKFLKIFLIERKCLIFKPHYILEHGEKCASWLAAHCFMRTSHRYCYFCDEALRFSSSLLPHNISFLANLHIQESYWRSRNYSELVFGGRLRQYGEIVSFFSLSKEWDIRKKKATSFKYSIFFGYFKRSLVKVL